MVVEHLTSGTQEFLPGSPESDGITCLAMSPSKRYLAVAEHNKTGTVLIYDLTSMKRRKMLAVTEVGSREYVSLSFSPDEKFLLAQGGAPEWNAVLFLWEKGRVMTTMRMSTPTAPIISSLFSTQIKQEETGTITVIGPGVIKGLVAEAGALREISLEAASRAHTAYRCQTVVPLAPITADDLETDLEARTRAPALTILGTEQGEMLVMRDGVVIQLLSREDGPGSITALVPSPRGFVAGGTGGVVCLVERVSSSAGGAGATKAAASAKPGVMEGEGREGIFTVLKQLYLPREDGDVSSVAVSPAGDALTVTTSTNRMYTATLGEDGLPVPVNPNGDEVFTLKDFGFHSASVTGLGSCTRRPVVATCSLNGQVRIWNYETNKCEFAKDFVEEAYSIALHPSGYMVAIGFADKLRLMVTMMDDLRLVKEFNVKRCRECQFSRGGQFLAAVNGSTISLFGTYTGETINGLRGHNGRVNAVYWGALDEKLVTTGDDGAIYVWRMDDFQRSKECESVLKGCMYRSLAMNSTGDKIYAVGSDHLLKEVDANGTFTQEIRAMESFSQLVLPARSRSMFAATDSGLIRAYRFPLTGEFQEPEIKAHHGRIRRMVVSQDQSVLFAAGDDGCLSVHEVKDVAQALREDKDRVVSWSEEVLVTKSDLEETKRAMQDLEQRLQDNLMAFDYEKNMTENHMTDEVRQLTSRCTAELEGNREAFERLLQEKNEMEMVNEERIKHADEQHTHRMGALDSRFQQRIMEEVERWQRLQSEREALEAQWREQQAIMQGEHERIISELTVKFEAELDEERMNIETHKREREELNREFEETESQMYQDYDQEIEELKEMYEKELAKERDVSLGLKGENGIMKKKFSQLQTEIRDRVEEKQDIERKLIDLDDAIRSVLRDNAGMKTEIDERDANIVEKEKKSYELKKKNQELEKFKFVLDFKIKELKKQIEPREAEIAAMKEKIKAMDSDLERFHRQNGMLEAKIAEMRAKSAASQNATLKKRSELNFRSLRVREIQSDLTALIQYIQNPKQLKIQSKKMYEKHVGVAEIEEVQMDAEIQNEYIRQRRYLEEASMELKEQLEAHATRSTKDQMALVQENVALIKEITELRRAIKDNKTKQAQALAATGNKPPSRAPSGRPGRTPNTNRAALVAAFEANRKHIAATREHLAQLDAEIAYVQG